MTNLAPPQNVALLTSKLFDADPDIRFMSLNDLQAIFNSHTSSAFLATDYNTCAKTIDGFLHTLNDTNGEVQNLTIKCLGPFVNRVHESILCPLIHKVGTLETEQTVDKSIPALAIRTIVLSLPRPSPSTQRTKPVLQAYDAISKVLIPRLVGYIVVPRAEAAKNLPDPPKGLLEEDLENGTDSNAIDVLTEVARCFGPMLQPDEVKALQEMTLKLLESDRTTSAMKKKAVAALSTLGNYFSDALLSSIVSHIIEALTTPHLTPANRRLYITIFGSVAKAIPVKFGPHLKQVAPFVLAALSQEELDYRMANMVDEEGQDPQADEVREAALVSLDAFLSSCSQEMQRYFDDCTEAALRFLRYDPNLTNDDDGESEPDVEEDADDEFEIEEDFEEDEGADDEDDVSWKVRRCAARTLNTLISIRGRDLLENATLYNRIVHAMIARFQEREETVRAEVLYALSFLIRKTGEEDAQLSLQLANGLEHPLPSQPPSRKRRRGFSDASMMEPMKIGRFTGSISPESSSPPPTGPPANLAKVSGDIVRGLLKLLKSTSLLTRQAAIGVLKDLVITRHGGADEFLETLLNPIVEAAATSTGTSASATSGAASGTTIQIQALQLISEIAKTHSSRTIQPYLARVIPAVIGATRNKAPKVACEALGTLEQLIKAVTPPRGASGNQKSVKQLEDMLNATVDCISAKNADLSVRQQGIHVLGTLLGRTLDAQGEKMIPGNRRSEAFELLSDTSRNETTRFGAIKTIEAMANQAPEGTLFDPAWFSKTCLELGAQLRKADRSLRAASLDALRALITRHPSSRNLDESSALQLGTLMLPLLTSDDLQMLGPVVLIFASMVNDGQGKVVTDEFCQQLSSLLKTPSAGSVLEPLCTLVQSIGHHGLGQGLMNSLLQVGILGSPAVVGKVIGNLVVSGAGKLSVTTNDFLTELKSASDDRRKSLALSVLGEIGLRSGSSSDLSPGFFVSYFESGSDEVSLVAAIALGRAAAGPGNLQTWVPSILSRIKQNPGEHYLALHSIKELLQYNENDKEIAPFSGSLWDASISAAKSDENRTVGAECVAHLTMIDPPRFLPALQSLLSDQTPNVRGIAIQAFRDVFTLADASYDKDLRPSIVDILTTMMRDSDVENRRSSLSTFNAAARNKPSLILPHMSNLLPLVLDQTMKDPSLTREVNMGPFKHTVDDGLEVRKNAYETLYSVVEIAPQRIDPAKTYERVIAGVADERGIQTLCNLMITKLAILAPEETVRRLEDIGGKFSTILAFTPKENAVRHEFEKADEAKKGAMKVSLELTKAFPNEAATKPKWSNYLDEMKKVKDGAMLKELEKEMRDRERS